MRLAEMLRLYIAANGLEQKAVAAEIGVSESSFSRFLAGNSVPDAIGFMRIVSWVTGVTAPKQTDLERRVETLEEAARRAFPALQAAQRFVPLGG